MANNSKPTKAEALASVQALISGLQKHFSTGSLTVGNIVYATSALVTLLQSVENAMTAQANADTAAKDALTALRNLQTTVGPVIQALKDLLHRAVRERDPDARRLRPRASQDADAADGRAAGSSEGQARRHEGGAWDQRSQGQAGHQGNDDGTGGDPTGRAGDAAREAGELTEEPQ